jgi:hypothetical protein
MRYYRTEWVEKDLDGELPTTILYEVDGDGWETRKLHFFPDGRVDFADGDRASMWTGLSETRMRDLAMLEQSDDWRQLLLPVNDNYSCRSRRQVDHRVRVGLGSCRRWGLGLTVG